MGDWVRTWDGIASHPLAWKSRKNQLMLVYVAGAKPVQELRSLDFLIFLVFDHDSISRGR